MKIALYWLVQWLWGLPQTMLGLAVFLWNLRRPHYRYRCAVVTLWHPGSSLSLGPFLFLGAHGPDGEAACPPTGTPARRVLVHEYGHTFQSLLLGPLFLPLIGLPSLLWCTLPAFERFRRAHRRSYYSVYTETGANRLGSRVTGEDTPR